MALEELLKGLVPETSGAPQDVLKLAPENEGDPPRKSPLAEIIGYTARAPFDTDPLQTVQLPREFGASKLDKKIEYVAQLDNIDDMRGQLQPLSDKVGNSIAKLVGGTAIHGVGSLVAFGAGTYSALSEWDKSKLWNNAASHYIDSLSEDMQEMFPHYYMEADREKSLLGQMGTYNFWGDELVNGLSFMTGAALSAYLTGGATSMAGAGLRMAATPLTRIQALNKVFNSAKDLKYVRALTAESAKSLGDLTWKQTTGKLVGETLKWGTYFGTGAMYESGLEARQAYDTVWDGYFEQIAGEEADGMRKRLGRELTKEEKISLLSPEEADLIERTSTSAANWNFAGNMALVGMGNMIMLSKLYGAGRLVDAAKRAPVVGPVTRTAGRGLDMLSDAASYPFTKAASKIGMGATAKGITKGTARWLGRAAYEGLVEEGGQGVMQQYAENYVTNGMYMSEDGQMAIRDYMDNLWENFWEAGADQFSTVDGQKEMMLGFLIGGMGMPKRFGGEGLGPMGSIREERQRISRQEKLQELARNISENVWNTLTEDQKKNFEKYVNQKHNVALYQRLSNRAQIRKAAEESGDPRALRQVTEDDLFDIFFALDETGRLDRELELLAKDMDSYTEEDAATLKSLMGLKEDVQFSEVKEIRESMKKDLAERKERYRKAQKLVDRVFPQLEAEKYTDIGMADSPAENRRLLIYAAARTEETDAAEKALIAEFAEITGGQLEVQDDGTVDEIVYMGSDGRPRTARMGTMNIHSTVGEQLLETAARISQLSSKPNRTVKEQEDLENLIELKKRLEKVSPTSYNKPVYSFLIEASNDKEAETLSQWAAEDPLQKMRTVPEQKEKFERAQEILAELRDLRASRIGFNNLFLQASDPESYAEMVKDAASEVKETMDAANKKIDDLVSEQEDAVQKFKDVLERMDFEGLEDIHSKLNKLNSELETASAELENSFAEITGLKELDRIAQERLRKRPDQKSIRVEGKTVRISDLRQQLETASNRYSLAEDVYKAIENEIAVTQRELEDMLTALDQIRKLENLTFENVKEFVENVEASENMFRDEEDQVDLRTEPLTPGSVSLMNRFNRAFTNVMTSTENLSKDLKDKRQETEDRLQALDLQITAAQELLKEIEELRKTSELSPELLKEESELKELLENAAPLKDSLLASLQEYIGLQQRIETLVKDPVEDYMTIRMVHAIQRMFILRDQMREESGEDFSVEESERELTKEEEEELLGEDLMRYLPDLEMVGYYKTALMSHEDAWRRMRDLQTMQGSSSFTEEDAVELKRMEDMVRFYSWVQDPTLEHMRKDEVPTSDSVFLLAMHPGNVNSFPEDIVKAVGTDFYRSEEEKKSDSPSSQVKLVVVKKSDTGYHVIKMDGEPLQAPMMDPTYWGGDGLIRFSGDFDAKTLDARTEEYARFKKSILERTDIPMFKVNGLSVGVENIDRPAQETLVPKEVIPMRRELGISGIKLFVAVPSGENARIAKLTLPAVKGKKDIKYRMRAGKVQAYDYVNRTLITMERQNLSQRDVNNVSRAFHRILRDYYAMKEKGVAGRTLAKNMPIAGKGSPSMVQYIMDFVQLQWNPKSEKKEYQLDIRLEKNDLHVVFGPEAEKATLEDFNTKSETYQRFMRFLSTKRYHVYNRTLTRQTDTGIKSVYEDVSINPETGRPVKNSNREWTLYNINEDLSTAEGIRYSNYTEFLLTDYKDESGKTVAPLMSKAPSKKAREAYRETLRKLKGEKAVQPQKWGGYLMYSPNPQPVNPNDISLEKVEEEAPEVKQEKAVKTAEREDTGNQVFEEIEYSQEEEESPLSEEISLKGSMDAVTAALQESFETGEETQETAPAESVDAQIEQLEEERRAALEKNNSLKIQDLKTKVAEKWKTVAETSEELREYIANEFAEKHDLAPGEVEILIEFVNLGEEDLSSNPFIYYAEYPEEVQKKYNLREKTKDDVKNQWARFQYKFPEVDREKISELAQLEGIAEHISHEQKGAFLAEVEGESGLPNNLAELNEKKINEEFDRKRAELEQSRTSSALFTSKATVEDDWFAGKITVTEGDRTATLIYDPNAKEVSWESLKGDKGMITDPALIEKIMRPLTPFMRLTQAGTMTFDRTLNEISEEIARAQRMTPMDVAITQTLIGRLDDPAVAQLRGYGDVLLSTLAPGGAIYHEAFHNVSLYVLSQRDADVMYNMVRSIPGKTTDHLGNEVNMADMTDMQAEEWLAEEFRKWMLSGMTRKLGADVVDDRGIIRRFFDAIRLMMRRLFNVNDQFIADPSMTSIEDVFRGLESGKFLKAAPSPRRQVREDIYMRARPDGMGAEAESVMMKGLLHRIVNPTQEDLLEMQRMGQEWPGMHTLFERLSGKNIRSANLAMSIAIENFHKDLSELDTEGDVRKTLLKEQILKATNLSGNNRSVNAPVIGRMLKAHLSNLGIDMTAETTFDRELDDAVIKEESDSQTKDSLHDRDLGEQSSYKNWGKETRFILSTLRSDGTDVFGMGTLTPMKDIYASLMRTMVSNNVTSINDVRTALENSSKAWERDLGIKIRQLQDAAAVSEDFNIAAQFISKISADLRKDRIDPYVVTSAPDGTMTGMDPAHVSAFQLVKSKWAQGLKNKIGKVPYLKLDGSVLRFDPTARFSIGDIFEGTGPELVKKFDNILSNDTILDIAEEFGIVFSDRARVKRAMEDREIIETDEKGKEFEAGDVLENALRNILEEGFSTKEGATNIVEMFDRQYSDEQGRVNRLARMEVALGTQVVEPQYMTPDNKLSYAIVDPTGLSFAMKKHSGRNEDGTRKLQWHVTTRSTSYARNSRYLNGTGEFKVKQIGGLRSEIQRDLGEKFSKLDIGSMTAVHIQAMLDGFTPALRAADKGTELAVNFGLFSKSPGSTKQKDYVNEILTGYFEDDIVQAVRTSSDDYLHVKLEHPDQMRFMHGFLEGSKVRDKIYEKIKELKEKFGDWSPINAEKADTAAREELKKWLSDNRAEIEEAFKQGIDRDARLLRQFLLESRIVEQSKQAGQYETHGLDSKYLGTETGRISEDRLDDLARDIAIRHFVGKNEMFKTVYGDPAGYPDLYKRMGGAPSSKVMFDGAVANIRPSLDTARWAPKQSEENEKGETMIKYPAKLLMLNEPVGEMTQELYDSLRELVSQEVQDQYMPGKDTDKADGTVLVVSDFMRYLEMGTGRWNVQQEGAFKTMLEGEAPKVRDPKVQMEAGMVPGKYQYFGPGKTGEVTSGIYLKMSTVPLDETLGEFNGKRYVNYLNLLKFLRENKLDGVVLPSSTKVGKSKKVYKGQKGENGEDVYTENHVTNQVITLDLEYMGLQQQVSNKLKGKVNHAVQAQAVLSMNMYQDGKILSDAEGNPLPGMEKLVKLHNEFNRIRTELVRREFQKLVEDWGIERTLDDRLKLSPQSLSSILDMIEEEGESREVGELVLSSVLEMRKVLTETGDFKLEYFGSAKDVERSLMSALNKRIIKPKRAGDMLVQVSEWLYEKVEVNGKIEDSKLGFYINKDGKRVMEVMMPNFMRPLFGKQLNITPEGIRDENGVLVADRKLLDGIGIRIPTDGIHSIDVIRVKEFLPDHAGPVVVVPHELLRKAGSDFDIDKLTAYLQNYRRKPDGRLVPQKYHESLEEWYEEESDEKLEAHNFLMERLESEVLDAPSQEDLDLVNTFMEKLFGEKNVEEPVTTKEQLRKRMERAEDRLSEFWITSIDGTERRKVPFESWRARNPVTTLESVRSKGALENRLNDLMAEILTANESAEDFMRPVSVDNAKKIAYDTENGIMARAGEKLGIPDLKNKADLHTSTTLPNVQRVSEAAFDGKVTVGPYALAITHHSKSQKAGLKIKMDPVSFLYGKNKKTVQKPVLRFEGFTPDVSLSLARVMDTSGRKISDNLSELVNSSVDNANEFVIHVLNAGIEVAGGVAFLIRAGVPLSTVAYFMNQPIVREYLKKEKRNKSVFLKAIGETEKAHKIYKSVQDRYNGEPVPTDLLYDDTMLQDMMEKSPEEMDNRERGIQQQILRDFMVYMELGNDLTSLVGAQSFDTKPPKSRDHAEIIIRRYKDVIDKDRFINAEKIVDDSYLDPMRMFVSDARNLFNDVSVIDSYPVFRQAKEMFMQYLIHEDTRMPAEKAAQELEKFRYATLTAILQRIPDSDGVVVGDNLADLMFGDSEASSKVKKMAYSEILKLGDSPFTEKGVNTMRLKGNNHFGNPWTATKSVKDKNPSLILVKDIPTAVRMYREWIEGKHPEVNPEQRKWIVENLHKLKGETLVYMQPRKGQAPYYSHADELAKIVNERFPAASTAPAGRSLAQEVLAIQSDPQHPLSGNPWINHMIAKVQSIRGMENEENDHLEPVTKSLNGNDQAVLYDAFHELQAQDPELAKKILMNAALQGMVQTPFEIMSMIPGDVYVSWAKNILSKFEGAMEDMGFSPDTETAAHQLLMTYMANQKRNPNIGPRLFAGQTEEHGKVSGNPSAIAFTRYTPKDKTSGAPATFELFMKDNNVWKEVITPRTDSHSLLNMVSDPVFKEDEKTDKNKLDCKE